MKPLKILLNSCWWTLRARILTYLLRIWQESKSLLSMTNLQRLLQILKGKWSNLFTWFLSVKLRNWAVDQWIIFYQWIYVVRFEFWCILFIRSLTVNETDIAIISSDMLSYIDEEDPGSPLKYVLTSDIKIVDSQSVTIKNTTDTGHLFDTDDMVMLMKSPGIPQLK